MEMDKDARDGFLKETIEKLDEMANFLGQVSLKLRNMSQACEQEMQADAEQIRVASLLAENLPPLVGTQAQLAKRFEMVEDWVCGGNKAPLPQVATPQQPGDNAEKTIEQLKEELTEAIKAEEYERAGEIRAQIDKKQGDA